MSDLGGASILGLTKVLSKKSKRDLDELAEIDLTKGVEYTTPAKSTINDSTTEITTQNKHTQIGVVHGTKTLRLPDGSFVKCECRLIAGADLAKVTIFSGNPRANSNPDITSLRAKIAITGGNIIPVIAREHDGGIEVIAGSRRTAAVRAEDLQLLADVIVEEITDVNAVALAFYENDERNDPDIFDQAAYFSKTFETYKKANLVHHIDDFARLFGMSKSNMGRYLNIATIPEWLLTLCPRTIKDPGGTVTNTWSLRKAAELLKIYNENTIRIDSDLEFQMKLVKIDDPEHLIRSLVKALNKPVTVNTKTAVTVNGREVGYFESGKRKNTFKLFLGEDAPEEIVSEIKRLVDSMQS